MICEKCEYTWNTRKETPKACPRCKCRLDMPSKSEKLRRQQDAKDKKKEIILQYKVQGSKGDQDRERDIQERECLQGKSNADTQGAV